ncbi:MAG: hypothetical protein IPM56_07295 [Ignavibacteriales bacterium]|nr:MAG: hypothetical protein IPM56_07295 [Ignavibacteriales bacterium]
MNGDTGDLIFPRSLKREETDLINFVLPEYKPGYSKYRELINNYSVLGKSSVKRNGLVLGLADKKPDEDFFRMPLFACGNVSVSNVSKDIFIYQMMDEFIEFEINDSVVNQAVEVRWTYSEWVPGKNSPEDGTNVREIKIQDADYILALARETKRIWLYEKDTGVNYLIPVTNYFNELMRYKNIRDPKIALQPNTLFKEMGTYSDEDLISALIIYNKYLHRFPLKERIHLVQNTEIKKQKFGFFRRNKN